MGRLDATALRALHAVRRRLRAQAALAATARASVPAAVAALVGIYLWRLGVLGERGLVRLLVAGGIALVTAALVGAARRIPLGAAARRIDASHGLHDRIGSALCFADEPQPTPFMTAAIDDAARAAAGVDVRRAAPLRPPDGLGASAVVAAVAAGVAILTFPRAPTPRPPAPPALPRLVVDAEALEPERAAARELAEEATLVDDEALKETAAELNKLLSQLDEHQLTRKEVFDKLDQIAKKMEAKEGDFAELKRGLRKAGAELGKEKLTRAAGAALAQEDLQQAKKELEKLAAEAQRLDAERKQQPQREELARSLDRASRAQPEKSPDEKKHEAEEKRLKEEQRRLQREMAQRPNDQELQRRLQRNQRELERLEREKQQRAEQRRQLERLQRELSRAAEQLRQKLSPEAAEAMRRAAQQLGQMENEIRKLGNMQKAQVQIAELKEVLRRAGRSQEGQSSTGAGAQAQSGSDGQDGKNGQNGKNGKNGKNGQNGKTAGGLMREFNQRAGGDGPKALLLGAGGGDQRVLLPLGGGGPQPGPSPQGAGPGEKGPPDDGIGNSHDPNLTGDPTRLAAKRHDTRVEGKEGPGPSRSETILGSAEKGFATRAYRRVYSDYTSVVEEVMSKEHVPPGYRYYVKRYFQLIKPRE
jgi:hypothetical protein